MTNFESIKFQGRAWLCARRLGGIVLMTLALQGCGSSGSTASLGAQGLSKPLLAIPNVPVILDAPFFTISMWPDNTSGDGQPPSLVNTGLSANPTVVQFRTGAQPGDVSQAQSYSWAAPSSFSVEIGSQLVSAGTNPMDGLHFQIQNSQNKVLHVAMVTSGFYLYQDGGWQRITALGGNLFTKWFLQVTDLGSGAHRVDLFANDQYQGSRSGVLPDGTTNDGYLAFTMTNQSATNQIAWLSGVKIARIGTDLLASLYSNTLPSQASVNSFTDAYSTASAIDPTKSLNAYWDARDLLEPLRTQSSTFLAQVFDSLTGWSQTSGQGGAMPLVAPTGMGDPATASVVELNAGQQRGGFSKINTFLSTVPASYGISILVQPSTSTDVSDGLLLQVQNLQNRNFQAKFCTAGLYVFLDGSWTLLHRHGGNYFTEWWFQLTDLGNGRHEVELYAGTRFVKSVSGALALGTGRNGQVTLSSSNGNSIGQRAQVSMLQIGLSALSKEMKIVSKVQNTASPVNWGKITVLVEDVSLGLVANQNLTASLSADGGQTWDSVNLMDLGVFSPGRLDDTKPIRILCGERPLSTPGSQMVYQINSNAGVLNVVEGVALEWH